MIDKILDFLIKITVFLAIMFIIYTSIIQSTALKAIEQCSGSPSCIESTASILLYKQTPCLDSYIYNKKGN